MSAKKREGRKGPSRRLEEAGRSSGPETASQAAEDTTEARDGVSGGRRLPRAARDLADHAVRNGWPVRVGFSRAGENGSGLDVVIVETGRRLTPPELAERCLSDADRFVSSGDRWLYHLMWSGRIKPKNKSLGLRLEPAGSWCLTPASRRRCRSVPSLSGIAAVIAQNPAPSAGIREGRVTS